MVPDLILRSATFASAACPPSLPLISVRGPPAGQKRPNQQMKRVDRRMRHRTTTYVEHPAWYTKVEATHFLADKATGFLKVCCKAQTCLKQCVGIIHVVAIISIALLHSERRQRFKTCVYQPVLLALTYLYACSQIDCARKRMCEQKPSSFF